MTQEATGVTPLLVTEDNITELAEQRWRTSHDPRLAELLTALVRHLHAFAREVRLTEDEWMAAVQWLTRTGRMSDEKRQEFILASDVLGLSMLVVQMNHRFDERATPATVLGPFYIEGSPDLEYGADMSDGVEGEPLFVHGTVRDLAGRPVAGAVLDVWQADADGAYEAQLDVDEARLRGRFRLREDGGYCVRTIAPKGYTIPMDGTVGDLISRTEISEYRPAHVHFRLDAPGFRPLVTHLFQEGAPYLDTDVVFGVKQQLVVGFERHEAGGTPAGAELDRPWLEARYDFVLQPADGPADRPGDGSMGGRR